MRELISQQIKDLKQLFIKENNLKEITLWLMQIHRLWMVLGLAVYVPCGMLRTWASGDQLVIHSFLRLLDARMNLAHSLPSINEAVLCCLLLLLLDVVTMIIESLRLENISKIIESKHQPTPTVPTDQVPQCHVSVVLKHLQGLISNLDFPSAT